MNMLKRFWEEEDGMEVVEMLLIIAVLIIIALLFKDAILSWVAKAAGDVFDVEVPKDTPTPTPK